jgi:hypothetical protein
MRSVDSGATNNQEAAWMTPRQARLFELAERMMVVLREVEAYLGSRRDISDEGRQAQAVRLHRDVGEVLGKIDDPIPLPDTDPRHCSCPRSPGGGRRGFDPLCAVHAGDSRD